MAKNSAQRRERAIVLMLLGMLCVLLVFFGGLVLKTHREYQNFKERENRIEAKLLQTRKEFDQKEAYLARLLDDPEFLERVVRERLEFARPDELLFRFSDEP
jgi:cell division protein FtsB